MTPVAKTAATLDDVPYLAMLNLKAAHKNNTIMKIGNDTERKKRNENFLGAQDDLLTEAIESQDQNVWVLKDAEGLMWGYYVTSRKADASIELEELHALGDANDMIEQQAMFFFLEDSLRANAPSICTIAQKGTEEFYRDIGFKLSPDVNPVGEQPKLFVMNNADMGPSLRYMREEIEHAKPKF